jgi:hypothetical protein
MESKHVAKNSFLYLSLEPIAILQHVSVVLEHVANMNYSRLQSSAEGGNEISFERISLTRLLSQCSMEAT